MSCFYEFERLECPWVVVSSRETWRWADDSHSWSPGQFNEEKRVERAKCLKVWVCKCMRQRQKCFGVLEPETVFAAGMQRQRGKSPHGGGQRGHANNICVGASSSSDAHSTSLDREEGFAQIPGEPPSHVV